MNVNKLKKLSEDLCYVKYTITSPLRKYLLDYMEKNKGTVYTTSDLVPVYREFRDINVIEYNKQLSQLSKTDKEDPVEKRRLQRRYIINDGGQKIKSRIYASLKKELESVSCRIKKKGSYYWYEPKEGTNDKI